jgi:phospholipase/lecithinase/hemolysin
LAGQTYERWNEVLRGNAKVFLSENEDVTTMVLSSWDFFKLVFGTPSEYGFEEGDIRKRYGPVWADHIHPTSRMHELFAVRVNEFLSGYPAGASSQLD